MSVCPYISSSAEIKKLVYWELDKQLRIEAAIGLWPSATGDAPVSHQKPTDEVTYWLLIGTWPSLEFLNFTS